MMSFNRTQQLCPERAIRGPFLAPTPQVAHHQISPDIRCRVRTRSATTTGLWAHGHPGGGRSGSKLAECTTSETGFKVTREGTFGYRSGLPRETCAGRSGTMRFHELIKPITWLRVGCVFVVWLGCLNPGAWNQSARAQVPPGRTKSLPERSPVTRSRPAKPEPGRGAAEQRRQSDRRTPVQGAAVAAQGIVRLESKRLVLYTDLPRDDATHLPALMDHAYDAWVAYCGELPPDREQTEFQMTGYLMADQERFRAAGLLPDNLPGFEHGRHRGQEFWMNDQPSAYYREHLLLHEGTHCFTTAVDRDLTRSVWFFEGIAEHFATHRTPAEGPPQFGIWPDQRSAFPHLGRIKILEEQRARGEVLSALAVTRQTPERFDHPDAYAWSWALVHFLAKSPETRESFQDLVQRVVRGESHEPLLRLLDDPRRQRVWQWFVADLCHGYDLERAWPQFREKPDDATDGVSCSIRADRGWQSSGISLQAGKSYRVSARGQVELARQPKPWVSEPAGVSIRYHAGLPLGRLVGRFWPADSTRPAEMTVISLGDSARYTPPADGILFLRVNEFWNELADNQGDYTVTIAPEE